ncbi:6090_t:CDS:2 [Ambispora gerdemannii]|uniref:V-type proton ATPase proteolipid subunit n=1 Tax=Ambispora gerdemannii TaxID=144530 RepID=A0A9N9CZ24_9GLOM|nr:6090_t:CDS:2 [Ambispora gerdemannii]
MSAACPLYAPFFGFAGVASAMVLSSIGAAYGTAKAGIGIAGMGTFKPELIMKAGAISQKISLIPVVMAGIIAVYGLVISVLIAAALAPNSSYSLFAGFIHLGAGLAVGLSGMAAGYTIGIVGDACVRGYAQQSRLFVTMVLILIFAEVLGLYGLIVALILNTKADSSC